MSWLELMAPFAWLAAFFLLAAINHVLDSLNLWVRNQVHRTRLSRLQPFMLLTHRINDVPAMSVQLALLSLLMGLYFGSWYRATVLAGTMVVQMSIIGLIKQVTAVDRPPQITASIYLASGSYPSGHSSISLSYALLVPAVFSPFMSPFGAGLLTGVLVLFSLLTAYGRLYLDVHWFTDLLGGWFLALSAVLTARLLL